MLAGGGGGTRVVRLWDVATGQKKLALKGHEDGVASLAFSPDGRTLASGGTDDDPWVRLWDVARGEENGILRWNTGSGASRLAFSPDGKSLAYVSGGRVSLWDVAAGERKAALPWDDTVHAVAFSPDGKTLATGGGNCVVRLWDVSEIYKSGK